MTKYALLFPGQGSQYVGMGKSFFASRSGNELIEQAESLLGLPLRRLLLEGPQEELTSTAIAQPAILLHSFAVFSALRDKESFEMSAVLGHSLGEYTALVAASVISFADALKAVHERGKLMQEAVPKGLGAMAAVLGLSAEHIAEVIQEFSDPESEHYAACANFNGPQQTVIAGSVQGLAKAAQKLKEQGAKRIIELQVSAPFHSALMKPAQEKMAFVLDAIPFKDACVPIISNVSAQPETKSGRLKELLLKQISNPVRFTECVMSVMSNNLIGSAFIELGPKNALSGIIKKINPSIRALNIDTTDDLVQFSNSRMDA